MASSNILNKIVAGTVALALIYVIVASLVLPYFSSSYRYCQALQWEGAEGNVYTNCTNRYQDEFNTTFLSCFGTTCTTHTENGKTSPVRTTAVNLTSYCLNCATLGGYRGAMQGIVLLILVLGLVGFGVYMMPKRRL